jgi:hypothetical protein
LKTRLENPNMALRCLPRLILGVLAVTAVDTARADVIFDLTPPMLSTAAGTTIEFTGTLTNTGSSEVFLNGDFSVLLFSSLKLDDLPFFANSPLSLAAGGGLYSGPFFDVIVDPVAVPGTYTGSFTIQGGADSSTFNNLASQNFQVTVVSAVPEPGTLVLFGSGLMMVMRRRSAKGLPQAT